MVNRFQITVDAANPRALGLFWCEVLGYIEQPPPPGFDNWDDALDAFGIDRTDPDRAFAIVPPDMDGSRIFFLKVPESKATKNRWHLDVAMAEDMHTRADELVELGASIVGEFNEPEGHWITLLDPEGNEFCIQAAR